jgi:hypothetical protein
METAPGLGGFFRLGEKLRASKFERQSLTNVTTTCFVSVTLGQIKALPSRECYLRVIKCVKSGNQKLSFLRYLVVHNWERMVPLCTRVPISLKAIPSPRALELRLHKEVCFPGAP